MSLNVLIVDDSSVMRSVVKKVLNVSGFELGEVYDAADGQQALEKLDEHWIDVVLTDINMPVMDGFELLRRIKADDALKSIPVVIISTEVRDEKIEEILGLGASGYGLHRALRPYAQRRALLTATERDCSHSSRGVRQPSSPGGT